MNLEKLVALIKDAVKSCHGEVYTGRNLSDNPDVCHAACEWFLHTVRNEGAVAAIAGLSVISKDTFQVSQRHAVEGHAMVNQAVANARSFGGGQITPEEAAALETLLNHHGQPKRNSYNADYNVVANEVKEAMKRNAAVMIYIQNKDDKHQGHAICVCGNVGGVLVYDPNIGVISLPARDRDALAIIIGNILSWYATEMKLNSFAFKPK